MERTDQERSSNVADPGEIYRSGADLTQIQVRAAYGDWQTRYSTCTAPPGRDKRLAQGSTAMACLFCLVALQAAIALGATFGTVVSQNGGASYSDIALDEARGKLYLVNPAANTIDVYSVTQKTFLSPISVPGQPAAEAMSRSGNYLYVTAYASSVLYQIDLNAGAVALSITVPYHPQGVGVGADERILITTVGPGSGTATSTLFLYASSGIFVGDGGPFS